MDQTGKTWIWRLPRPDLDQKVNWRICPLWNRLPAEHRIKTSKIYCVILYHSKWGLLVCCTTRCLPFESQVLLTNKHLSRYPKLKLKPFFRAQGITSRCILPVVRNPRIQTRTRDHRGRVSLHYMAAKSLPPPHYHNRYPNY